jgi:methionyl-tRNA formyltransferase
LNLKLIYAGTPEFAVPTLQALVARGHTVLAVYTQPDRKAGRGQLLSPSAVKQAALSLGLPVFTPHTLKDPAVAQHWQALQPDVVVVAAYGQLVSPELLALPRFGCINIHASLLPRWRGAAPIQRAILANDLVTGISIMQMAEGLDTGAVWSSTSLAIDPMETAAQLTQRLSQLGAKELLEFLASIGQGSPTPQASDGVTYAHKITRQDAAIDWRQSAQTIHNQIRALQPWPVAETTLASDSLKIHTATLARVTPLSEAPGTVMAVSPQGIEVATGHGSVLLTALQRPGRATVAAAAFISGFKGQANLLGQRLGTQ